MELIINNLSKTYTNGVQALKDLSLEIPKGMFGLLGPNGAGKSTLMRTIATLQEADNGAIDFNGINVLTQKQDVRKILGYLPQQFGVYPKISAQTLLDHFAALKGISNKKDRKEVVESLLHKTNLYESRSKNIGGFSGGMKQRFGIAQALIGSPQLIIVDEPTSGLDPTERNRFHDLLSEIGENIIVILSTHIVEDVSDLCSNMAIINRGELKLAGKPSQLIDNLNGKIWEKRIEKSSIQDYKTKHNVISSRLFAGKPLIKVLTDKIPDSEFASVAPNLEDVYFSTIN